MTGYTRAYQVMAVMVLSAAVCLILAPDRGREANKSKLIGIEVTVGVFSKDHTSVVRVSKSRSSVARAHLGLGRRFSLARYCSTSVDDFSRLSFIMSSLSLFRSFADLA